MAPNHVLIVKNICKRYGDQTILDQISLSVASGEIFGLLGPNGAGKTTLMKVISGLSLPDTGHVEFLGAGSSRDRVLFKRLVGLVPQESNLERELTVEEALLVYARLFGVERPQQRVTQVMCQFDLLPLRTKKVGLLSGGMARRAMIARVLLPEPRLLLLDEPTVGLDPDVRQDIWQIIQGLAASGKTIFMTTHYMDEAEQLCHRIALLKLGKIVASGAPETLKNLAITATGTTATLEEAFIRLIREESA
jgi:ABC-type multidrug transport system ATPase subunit